MTKVCIHQPDFAPYLGFFDRLADSDVFVVLDDVQFLRRGWHHRDKIKTATGTAWLTLHIQKGDYHQKIREAVLSPDKNLWVTKLLGQITENYRQANYYGEMFSKIESIIGGSHEQLLELNMEMIEFLLDELAIEVQIVMASEFSLNSSGTQRLIDLTKLVGGDTYLSGLGAVDYLEPELFEKTGVGLEMQDFTHPTYPQQFGEFIPNLSAIDLVLNCGRSARAYFE